MTNAADIDIQYLDNHLIAINKPAGVLSQGDKTGDEPITDQVKAYLKKTFNKPGNVYLGLLHRLDRPTTGLLLMARTSKAASRMSEAFAQGAVKKTYTALVRRPESAVPERLTHFLTKDREHNVVRVFDDDQPGAKKAVLAIKVLRDSNPLLVEIDLETGRGHQIRAQLAHASMPIQGDHKYGRRQGMTTHLSLHASGLRFEHPVTKEMITISCPAPFA